MNTVTKTLMTIETLNLTGWYRTLRTERKEVLNALPAKVLWKLRKNMDEIVKVNTRFTELQEELNNDLKAKYFEDDEKSILTTEKINGEDQEVRKVKDEYMDAFATDRNEVEQKLQEILREPNEVKLSLFNMDELIESIDDNAGLTMDDLDMLSVFDIGEGE